MLCTSIRHHGDEYVAWPRTITEFRRGGATAVPLLHPWANRLGRFGGDGDTGRSARRRHFPSTRPASRSTETCSARRSSRAKQSADHVVATTRLRRAPEKLRAFPFPHTVTVDARLHADRGLTITTEVRPTSDRAVPISFGWHPYLRLPHAPRREWELRWPACEHIEVDERVIPTGVRTPQPEQREPIGLADLRRPLHARSGSDVHDPRTRACAHAPTSTTTIPTRSSGCRRGDSTCRSSR